VVLVLQLKTRTGLSAEIVFGCGTIRGTAT